ncbi:MAG: AbrB/MazE/SpoVT family DNA-binding domain-containing protein [Chloroflexi bacterium]|nr:AbrB/MazE/SpoVT family DNA-binding domain-containing protein [Chloroflexota bacterium]
MLVKLSSKGQLVIPRTIRQKLKLERDALFHLQLTEEGKIVLEPIETTTLDTLAGKYTDADFLTDLEREHGQEMGADTAQHDTSAAS